MCLAGRGEPHTLSGAGGGVRCPAAREGRLIGALWCGPGGVCVATGARRGRDVRVEARGRQKIYAVEAIEINIFV